jgi:ABC-type nitrate/sulfonate/bicarbonate transport system substrate-binding protein
MNLVSMPRRAWRSALFAAAAAALAAAPAVAKDLTPWRQGAVTPKSDAGFDFMVGNGFAQRQGIDIQWMKVHDDAIALKALIAGDMDGYQGGPGDAIIADSRGADIKIIGCAWPHIPHGIFVRDTVNSLKDLEGKRVAVSSPGAMPDILVRAALRRAGVPTSSIRFANLGGDLDRYKALVAGVVDAAVVSSEYTPILDKHVKLLVAGRDALPKFLRSCTMVNGKFLDAHRDLVARFMAADIEALRYAASHKKAMVALTDKVAHIKPSDPRPAFMFDQSTKYGDLDPDMHVDEDQIAWLQQLLVKNGNVKTPIDPHKLVAPEVRQAALKIIAQSGGASGKPASK